jgi:uncharacterized protein YbjT (DUF2867 family)
MILVTGATGNIGQPLVHELEARSAAFRILARDRDKTLALFPSADIVEADLDESRSIAAAMDGAEQIFLLNPGIGTEHTSNIVFAATNARVRHIVLLSSLYADQNPVPSMGRWHHQREQILESSGIPNTFLRPGGFMSNLFEWIPTIREGFVLDPIGPGRVALIDPADVATSIAVVLTESAHEGKRYVLTGDEPLTVAEQTQILARVLDRPIAVRTAESASDAVSFRYPQGTSPELADALIESLEHLRADTIGFRTATVRHLLGRDPGTLADWCARNAFKFRFSA